MAAPVVTIYKNGDNHFYGKKLVVNPKNISTFDNFLDKVTRDTHARVAIRRLCTPHHGSRIIKLDQLQNGGVYVAVGAEKFKKLQYDALRSTHAAFQPRKPATQNIKPVLHSRIHASARHKKAAQAEPLRNRIIFVYSNGDTKHPGIKLLLDKRILQSMDIVLQYVTDKIKLRTGAVKSIHTLDGVEIKETKELVTGSKYVAVGYGKLFIKTMYSENTPFSVTPRRLTQSKNSYSVNSSPKNKSLKKNEAKVRKKSVPDKPENEKVKPERKWRTHLKKGKLDEESSELSSRATADEERGNTGFLAQLTDQLDTVVDNVSNDDTSFLKSSFHYNENDKNVENEKHDNVEENENNDKMGREGTFDRYSPNTDNTIPLSEDHTMHNEEEAFEVMDESNTNDAEIQREGTFKKSSVSKNKKKKTNAFGTAYDKTNASKRSSVSSDHLSESHNSSRKISRKNSKERKSSIESNKVKRASINSTSDSISKKVDLDNNNEILHENDTNNELSGTPPASALSENETSNDVQVTRQSEYNDSIEDQAINEKEATSGHKVDNDNDFSNEDDVVSEVEDTVKSESPIIYDASGEQSEKADLVKDNQETNVEKTFDMQEAEEVDEEIIENEDADDDHNADDKNLITIKN